MGKNIYYRVKNSIGGIIIATAVCSLLITATGDGDYVTKDDPLVSLSYVEKMREEIKAEVKAEMEDKIAEMVRDEVAKQSTGGGAGTADYNYENVALRVGEKLMAKGNCELLLRSGSAKAVCPSQSQCLTDKTTEISLKNGADILKNHLISIPKADGRGIVSTLNGTEVMVRGEYEIVSK